MFSALSIVNNENFNDFVTNARNILMGFQWTDALDILILALLFYFVLRFFRSRKAGTLFIGISICVVLYALALFLNLTGVKYILSGIFQIGALAVVIIFQPEIRDLLESIGSGSIKRIRNISELTRKKQAQYKAIDNIWDNIVNKKLYITGGIGATASGEAFGRNYELPNMSAYCETCAAIGNVYVNHRLFLLHGESKYYDVLERSLYNGLISGVSLDGGKFFYPNPLESMGQHQRQAWFGCACCPSNISRFIPSLPGYVYAVKDRAVYVNLFLSNSSTLSVAGKQVGLTQTTGYPYCGDINIKVDRNSCGQFDLKIRIPGWLKSRPVSSDLYSYSDNKRLSYSIKVIGAEVADAKVTEDGYFTIPRKWKKGDQVSIHFDMEPRTVRANEKVEADRGMISIERGPLVYCAEWPDNKFDIKSVLINQNPEFELAQRSLDAFIPEESKAKLPTYKTQQLTTLTTDAQTLTFNKEGKLVAEDVKLTLIPYYAWCHRGNGDMKVWIPQDLKATNPAAPATLASESKIGTSMRVPALSSINDRLVPKNGNDRSIPYTHWWPKNGSTEWLTYTFPEEADVQSCTVYWFDDQPWGGCRVPDSWKIYYQDANGNWQPVEEPDGYPVAKGEPCTVNFKPVKTKAVKLEVTMNKRLSGGVFEWIVK